MKRERERERECVCVCVRIKVAPVAGPGRRGDSVTRMLH